MRNSAFDFLGRNDEFMILFFPAESILELRALEEAKNPAGKRPPPDSDPLLRC